MPREARRLAVLVAVVIALAASATAEPRPVHPYKVATGQRVRLWSAPEWHGFQATDAIVTATDATGLTVVVKDRTDLVPFDSLERLDVRRNWRYLRRAAVVGLAIGAVAGALDEEGDDEDVIRSAALYGAVGAGVGALTAAAIWPARWMPVELDAVRPPIERPAARLSFTLRF